MKGREEERDGPLPPRRKAHASRSNKWAQRFYGTLVFLLLLLIVALIGWFVWFAE
jgi:cobalamin biosynthesis protein CobD/CbiB